MQAAFMAVPILAMGWALSGGWEDAELRELRTFKAEDTLGVNTLVALHVGLLVVPCLLGMFSAISFVVVAFRHRLPVTVKSDADTSAPTAKAKKRKKKKKKRKGKKGKKHEPAGDNKEGSSSSNSSDSWSSWSSLKVDASDGELDKSAASDDSVAASAEAEADANTKAESNAVTASTPGHRHHHRVGRARSETRMRRNSSTRKPEVDTADGEDADVPAHARHALHAVASVSSAGASPAMSSSDGPLADGADTGDAAEAEKPHKKKKKRHGKHHHHRSRHPHKSKRHGKKKHRGKKKRGKHSRTMDPESFKRAIAAGENGIRGALTSVNERPAGSRPHIARASMSRRRESQERLISMIEVEKLRHSHEESQAKKPNLSRTRSGTLKPEDLNTLRAAATAHDDKEKEKNKEKAKRGAQLKPRLSRKRSGTLSFEKLGDMQRAASEYEMMGLKGK